MLFRYPFVAMGSGCEVLIQSQREGEVKSFVHAALAAVQRLEMKYSFFRESSLLAAINREAHERPVPLDEESLFLFRQAGEIHRLTQGAFDPTVGTLRDLWDFKEMALPDPERLLSRLPAVGWHHVHLEGESVRLDHPETRIDFGGLVKEYAIDAVVSVLESLGVQRGLVNLGGDLRLIGHIPADSRPFHVGVAHPRRHHGTCATLMLRRGAVVTSGDYQRYFLRDGRRYHHLLDPRTGLPAPLRFAGVTAHGQTALDALKGCKGVLFAPPESTSEPDAAFVACDLEGEPAAWRESEACAFTIGGSTQRALGARRTA